MHKQHRYFSLLLLTCAVSGAKAMEGDGAAVVEASPDKYAILKPTVTGERRTEILGKLNGLVDEQNPKEIIAAYRDAVELEIDQLPDQRDKMLVAKRKELWAQVKALSATDANAAHVAVDYLSGSEDEDEKADEPKRLDQLVKRVQRRDGHLAKQAVRLQTLEKEIAQASATAKEELARVTAEAQKEEAAAKADGDQRAAKLAELLAQKTPLDGQMQGNIAKEAEFKQQEEQIDKTQAAAGRVADYALLYVQQDEPALQEYTREQLMPVIAHDLAAKQDQVAKELALILAATKALAAQIDPLSAEIEKLNLEQDANAVKQAALEKTNAAKLAGLEEANAAKQAAMEQLIALAKKAQSLAQKDRDKLFATLDQRIEVNAAQRETLKSEAAVLAKQAAAEQDKTQKATLLDQKKAKDSEVATLVKTISDLKVARAYADNSYTYSRWLRGYYNGDN